MELSLKKARLCPALRKRETTRSAKHFCAVRKTGRGTGPTKQRD
jgi:hypothetical protein